MATFPVLKTGAVAQYPLGFGVRYSTHAVRFLDGSQQKYALIGTGLRRWTISLDLLDEQELGAVIAFVEHAGERGVCVHGSAHRKHGTELRAQR